MFQQSLKTFFPPQLRGYGCYFITSELIEKKHLPSFLPSLSICPERAFIHVSSHCCLVWTSVSSEGTEDRCSLQHHQVGGVGEPHPGCVPPHVHAHPAGQRAQGPPGTVLQLCWKIIINRSSERPRGPVTIQLPVVPAHNRNNRMMSESKRC